MNLLDLQRSVKRTKMIIDANTTNLEKLISDLDLCAKNYNQAVDTFFKTIENSRGVVWEGDAAKEYYDRVIADKVAYVDFGEELNSFCLTLFDTNNDLNSTINKSSRV